MNADVWIIVVNYNGEEDTRKCLCSLEMLDAPANIVVVDNASKNDITIALQSIYPWVVFIRSEINLGWAGGNNLGIRYALSHGADIVVLLNNDTVVYPSLVRRTILAFDSAKGYGVLGPIIRFMDPPYDVQVDGTAFNRVNTPGFFSRIQIPITPTDPPSLHEVDIVNGCCMAIQSHVFDTIGYIDEDFFLIHEESDFCLRAQASGFKNGVLSESFVWHKGGVSFKREGNSLRRYYDSRNVLKLIHSQQHVQHRRNRVYSFFYYLLYCYYRYHVEIEASCPGSANAVVDGMYDGLLRRSGPRAERPRPGIYFFHLAFRCSFYIRHKIQSILSL